MTEYGAVSSGLNFIAMCDATPTPATPADDRNSHPHLLLVFFSRSNLPPEPFFCVAMVLLGHFPTSTSDMWVAVATDCATWCAVTRAIASSRATEVADFLLHDRFAPWCSFPATPHRQRPLLLYQKLSTRFFDPGLHTKPYAHRQALNVHVR